MTKKFHLRGKRLLYPSNINTNKKSKKKKIKKLIFLQFRIIFFQI